MAAASDASTASDGSAAARGSDLRVALLGTGIMGSGMARSLLRAGLPVTVWNRSPGPLAALGEAGARVAGSPGEAVADARLVITMLSEAPATQSVMFDQGGADNLPDGAVWAQMATLGVAATGELAARIARQRPGVLFVDAPVSGTRAPAEQGALTILASGPPEVTAIVGPAFSALGRKVIWLGEAGQGSRMKVVVNAYLSLLMEGMAEAMALAHDLGLPESRLSDVIEGGPLDAQLVEAKMAKIGRGDFSPDFPLEWALKDVDLALEAAGGDGSLPVLRRLSAQWRAAVEAGHGRQDVAAARLALSR